MAWARRHDTRSQYAKILTQDRRGRDEGQAATWAGLYTVKYNRESRLRNTIAREGVGRYTITREDVEQGARDGPL